MSVHDPHAWDRQSAPPRRDPGVRRFAPTWRWLAEGLWWIENAFNRAKADARPEEDTRVRIFLILCVFSVVFVGLALGAANAALLKPKAGGGLAANPGAVVRGDMVDRNGALLATNLTHYKLYVDPAQVWDRDAAMIQIRRALPRVPARALRNAMFGDRRRVVLEGLTPQEKALVHDLALGGVTFEEEDRRTYPLAPAARQVVGRADLGGEGISGAEQAFNRDIREAGARGESFPLSIDLRVQGVVENELTKAAIETQAKGAVAIVSDVQTGEILAMASWPLDGPNRATTAHYEMGSVFKTFTVAAGIDTGRADMNTLFDASKAFMIGNRRITDFHATNQVLTLEEVYLHSSNIGTSRLAVEMGPNTMRDYFTRLGLMDAAPIELTDSARPRRPTKWDDSTLASLSFGYGIMITPLQMTAAMNSLTNGGQFRPLTLRKGGLPGVQPRRVVSEQTSLTLLDLMRRNVVRGSGTRADAPGLRVGGKTGSANKLVNGRYNPASAVGTFAGVFPVDGGVNARRYTVLVLVDEPGSYPKTGGFVAAPAVGRIIDRIAPFLDVERRDDAYRTRLGEVVPAFEDVEGDGR